MTKQRFIQKSGNDSFVVRVPFLLNDCFSDNEEVVCRTEAYFKDINAAEEFCKNFMKRTEYLKYIERRNTDKRVPKVKRITPFKCIGVRPPSSKSGSYNISVELKRKEGQKSKTLSISISKYGWGITLEKVSEFRHALGFPLLTDEQKRLLVQISEEQITHHKATGEFNLKYTEEF